MLTAASLSVAMIVRDEELALPGALASLDPLRRAGVLDLVHIHDTGSSDGTVALARAWGAVVTEGRWEGDFSAARTAARRDLRSPWVLSLDADERVVVNPAALAALLAGSDSDVYAVEIANTLDTGDYSHRAERLFRPERTRWQGRVHEHLVAAAPPALRFGQLPATVLRLRHEGYATEAVRREKSARNVVLAQADLDELALAATPDPVRVARTLLDLGRSLAGAGRTQDAVDAFEALRELAPGTHEARQGTEALARLLLAAGLHEVVLHLADELRATGGSASYAAWLQAQALAQLGHVEEAFVLVRSVDVVVDSAGRRYPAAELAEMRTLLRALCRSTR